MLFSNAALIVAISLWHFLALSPDRAESLCRDIKPLVWNCQEKARFIRSFLWSSRSGKTNQTHGTSILQWDRLIQR
jgi:hypothetical protein